MRNRHMACLPQTDLIDSFFNDFNTFFNVTFPDITIPDISKNIEGYPVANVFTNKDGDVKFEIAVTGFTEKELSVSIENGLLTIKGEKEDDKEKEDDGWRFVAGKLKHSTFEKRYRLSNKMDIDKMNAKIKDGVLTILIRSKEDVKPKEIPITVG